jgi:hypothetical protein
VWSGGTRDIDERVIAPCAAIGRYDTFSSKEAAGKEALVRTERLSRTSPLCPGRSRGSRSGSVWMSCLRPCVVGRVATLPGSSRAGPERSRQLRIPELTVGAPSIY